MHTLIDIVETMLSALDSSQSACGLFIDFEKAFDTVNHNILPHKLTHYDHDDTITHSWRNIKLVLHLPF